MIVDQIVRDPKITLQRILRALDSNLTARDNFGPEGQEGWVLTSHGPDHKPSYGPIVLTPETEIDWSAISGTPTTLAGYGIENVYTATQVDAILAGHTHDAAAIISGILNPSRLGSGASGAGTYLRGDNTWQPRSLAGLGIASEVAGYLAAIAMRDAEGPDEPMIIPGPKGDTGAAGAAGAPGFGTINNVQLSHEEYNEDIWSMPGPSGSAGAAGAAGTAGLRGPPGEDAEADSWPFMIPGSQGLAGLAGPQGLSIMGPAGSDGDPGDDGVSIPGAIGPRGYQGERGAPGEAAETDDWSFVIPGPSGAAGPAGPAGPSGTVLLMPYDSDGGDDFAALMAFGLATPPTSGAFLTGVGAAVGALAKFAPTGTNLGASIATEAAGMITVTGDLKVTGDSYIDGAAGTVRDLLYTTTGALRWIVRVDGTAEGGANSGSNFAINRRSDAGADLGDAFSIDRATGVVVIGSSLIVGSSAAPDATSYYLHTATGAYSDFRVLRNNLNRWIWEWDDVAEAGANVGTDMTLFRYSDAGASLGAAAVIRRSDGRWLFENEARALKFAIDGAAWIFGPGADIIGFWAGGAHRFNAGAGSFYGQVDNTMDLGGSVNRWRDVYCTRLSDGATAAGTLLSSTGTVGQLFVGTGWTEQRAYLLGVQTLSLGAARALFAKPVMSPGSNISAADQAAFNAVQTNITGGSFAIGANEAWIVDAWLPLTMVGATGIKFYFTGPAGATGEVSLSGTGAALTTIEHVYTAAITVPGTFLHRIAGAGYVWVRATVRSAATPGTIQLVGISGAVATTCVVKKGFSMLAERIT